jgi:hypothetical protein
MSSASEQTPGSTKQRSLSSFANSTKRPGFSNGTADQMMTGETISVDWNGMTSGLMFLKKA